MALFGGWGCSLYAEFRGSSLIVGPYSLDAVFVFEEWRSLIFKALITVIQKEEKPERQGVDKRYGNCL